MHLLASSRDDSFLFIKEHKRLGRKAARGHDRAETILSATPSPQQTSRSFSYPIRGRAASSATKSTGTSAASVLEVSVVRRNS